VLLARLRVALSSPVTYSLFPVTYRRNAAGMTMIELCVVMGIATVLMAMVLGLSRHVNEIVKNRHAQADLGEWHETLNDWFLKFGMYPDSSVPPFNSVRRWQC
jgi:Tfp pilus assembly protein PilE